MRGIVVSFRGQYNHLIKRRLVEGGVQASLIDYKEVPSRLKELNPDLIVLGGGPYSAETDHEMLLPAVEACIDAEVPVLGICLAHQLIARAFGGSVGPSETPEYGNVIVEVVKREKIFEGLPSRFSAWASHNEEVKELPRELRLIAKSDMCQVEAFKHVKKELYGLQFHPEVEHTSVGRRIFENLIRLAKGWG